MWQQIYGDNQKKKKHKLHRFTSSNIIQVSRSSKIPTWYEKTSFSEAFYVVLSASTLAAQKNAATLIFCEAREMFRGLQNFTPLPINTEEQIVTDNFHFWVKCFFKAAIIHILI